MKKNKGGGEGPEREKKKRGGKMGMGKVGKGGARGRAEEKEDIEERNVSLILTKISGSL